MNVFFLFKAHNWKSLWFRCHRNRNTSERQKMRKCPNRYKEFRVSLIEFSFFSNPDKVSKQKETKSKNHD